MNNLYALINNSFDTSMYYVDKSTESDSIKFAKTFPTRQLANKFLKSRDLNEKYSVKLLNYHIEVTKAVTESCSSSKNNVVQDIQSLLDDTKDMVEITLEYLNRYNNDEDLNENFEDSNLSEVIKKLKKINKYLGGVYIAFKPSFEDSGVRNDKELNSPGIDSPEDNGGDSIESD